MTVDDNKRRIDAYFDDHHNSISEYCNYVNSNAAILTNWLYGLSLGGFAVVAWISSSKIYGSKILYGFWFFLVSLILCVLSTALEWARFSTLIRNERKEFFKLRKEKFTRDACEIYSQNTTESFQWLFWVTILRVLGYIALLLGAIFLWFHISHGEVVQNFTVNLVAMP